MNSDTQHTQPSTPYTLDSSSRHRIPLKAKKERWKKGTFSIAASNDPPDRFTYYDFDRLICPKPDRCCPPRDEKKRKETCVRRNVILMMMVMKTKKRQSPVPMANPFFSV